MMPGSQGQRRYTTGFGGNLTPAPNAAVSAASSSTVPVREPKTCGGTPLLPAGEDAGATILPLANEFLVRVSNCAHRILDYPQE